MCIPKWLWLKLLISKKEKKDLDCRCQSWKMSSILKPWLDSVWIKDSYKMYIHMRRSSHPFSLCVFSTFLRLKKKKLGPVKTIFNWVLISLSIRDFDDNIRTPPLLSVIWGICDKFVFTFCTVLITFTWP